MTKVPLTSLRSYLFSPVYYSAFSFFAMRRIGSHPAILFPKHSFGCSVGKTQRAIETVNQVDTSLRLKLKTVRLLWFVRNMIYAKGRARNSSGHKGMFRRFQIRIIVAPRRRLVYFGDVKNCSWNSCDLHFVISHGQFLGCVLFCFYFLLCHCDDGDSLCFCSRVFVSGRDVPFSVIRAFEMIHSV